jgi:hypothetical protein
MDLRRNLSVFLAAAAIAASCAAQQATAAQDVPPTHLKENPVPQKMPAMPFPPGQAKPDRVHTIEFRNADQMTEKDKLLEADAESSIQERTTWSGMEFGREGWSYRQVVCPALTNHLFLQFTRNNGIGDVSIFSASVPRNGEGRVRIVPIQRRGYSLFSPAPINALTISAFNHIRAEEHQDGTPDWLGTGLCYAALAGAQPETTLMPESAADEKFPLASAPAMEIPSQGGAIIRFADIAAPRRPMEWTMTFNGKGKLLKATHSPAPMMAANAVPANGVDLKGKPIPPTVVDGAPIQTQ